jgi:hypothetical protein
MLGFFRLVDDYLLFIDRLNSIWSIRQIYANTLLPEYSSIKASNDCACSAGLAKKP